MAESSIAALLQTKFFEFISLLLVAFQIYPSKGWNISYFCSLLWHLAQILVWQGFERPFPQILPNFAPKRSTPFYFAVSRFLFSPKKITSLNPHHA